MKVWGWINPCSLEAAGQKWVINPKLCYHTRPFTVFILIESHENDARLIENNRSHLYTQQTRLLERQQFMQEITLILSAMAYFPSC